MDDKQWLPLWLQNNNRTYTIAFHLALVGRFSVLARYTHRAMKWSSLSNVGTSHSLKAFNYKPRTLIFKVTIQLHFADMILSEIYIDENEPSHRFKSDILLTNPF